jgi:Domain of unknown function (DUF4440)
MQEKRIRVFVLAIATTLGLVPANAQQSHWASTDDTTAKYIVGMERKWAEGVCADNGVVASLLADDFQGTSTSGARFTKADELRDEKSARSARDCGLGETRVRFFGDSIALVYGNEHYVGKDKSRPNAKVCQVWTDTWLQRGGKWQIVASQDNRLECK